jgi:hypothetical protein
MRVAGILAYVTTRMHADELEIDEPLVRRLLAESSRSGAICPYVASSRAVPTTPFFGWVMSCRCASRGMTDRWSRDLRSSLLFEVLAGALQARGVS